MSRRMIQRILEQCLYLTLLLIILQGCANPLPPSGGPRDTEPPSIVRTIPTDRTLLFSENTLLIEFSEYVDRTKALQSIMITPAVKYEASWSGKELELSITEPLQKNITYALSIGTDYADFSGNKPSQSHTIIFSTGNSLDSGMIQGNVFGQSAGAYVFLLSAKDSISFDPSKQSTTYKTQIGANGQFAFNALSTGTYRMYALQDLFKDGLYDIGTDGFAMASRDITIPSESQSIAMKLSAPEDTLSPMLSMVMQTDKGVIEIRCTEPIFPESIHAKGFDLRDEAGNVVMVLSAYGHYQKSHTIVLEHAIDQFPKTISLSREFAPNDSAGNILMDTLSQRDIQKRDEVSPKPKIHSLSVRDSGMIAQNPMLELILTHSIDIEQLSKSIKMQYGTIDIPLNIRAKSNNHIMIQPKAKLTPDAWHAFNIILNGMTDKRGISFQDTTISFHLKTMDDRNFGSIKGELSDPKGSGPYFIIIKNEKGQQYSHRIEKQGIYSLTDIPVGTYSIEIFEDKNNDGKHDLGSIKPFRFSERITQRKETITVRPRWTMDGINIQFREP